MAVEKSYARLGLFLVVAVLVMLATALVFIQRLRSRDVIELVTYSDENVAGLDISSPVRYRGVAVGRVSDLRVDPRGRLIQIQFEIFEERLGTIGADVQRFQQATITGMVERLRTQVIGNPVTGEAYLLVDYPENPPAPPDLGFTPDRPYIPSMPTPLAQLEDRLPAVLERAEATLAMLREIVARVPDSLDRSDRFFTTVERIFQQSDLPALSADSRKFFATTSSQVEQMASTLDGLVGESGTLVKFANDTRAAIEAADFAGSSRSAREAADRSNLAADDLRRSLPAIRESLEALRELARQLQEQPESVVYGPRPAGAKPK